MEIDPTVWQAIAAILIPALVAALKRLAPALKGQPALIANIALNLIVGLGLVLGIDVDPGQALAVATLGGFGGAKIRDIRAYGAAPSRTLERRR